MSASVAAAPELAVLLVRPEARHSENHIKHALIADGFKILERKHFVLSPEQAQAHYVATTAGDIDRHAFDDYVEYLSTAGSSIVLLLSRFNAFDELKTLLGPTDLLEAKDFAPNSLRAKFAVSSKLCALEATLTSESAESDLRTFFPNRLRTTLPSSDETKLLLDEELYPVLTEGLTRLCKAKPANPTTWLGNWLLENNPNRPKVSEVAPAPAAQLGAKNTSTQSIADAGAGDTAIAGDGDWLPPKVLLKPPGQLQLSEAELEEELTRILNANNPHAPQNISRYNHKEGIFKTSPNVDHVVVHFEFDGYLVYKVEEVAAEAPPAAETSTETEATGAAETGGESNEDASTAAAAAVAALEEEKKPKGPLRNQFNFSERAAQTINNPFRERSTNTEPPPARVFCDTVNQWAIYDAYMEDLQAKEKIVKDKAKADKSKANKDDDKQNILPTDTSHNDDAYYKNIELKKALIIVERMANQNTFDDVAQDYKYWEDASDELGGSLLPLWKFSCEKEKRKQVTGVCWNPKNTDLFAVGFGSYDFSKQGPGMIACFTLKNPSYPEFLYTTESGVMCLDFHPQHPSMIAVGLYDGSVLVYNMQKKINTPLFRSNLKSGKHTDPVWQVCWQKDDLDDNMNFFSVSSDGRVAQWTLLQNDLVYTEVIRLRLNESGAEGSGDDEALFSLAGGCCFDFHKSVEHLFVVGTEEGRIHKCSKTYNSQYLLSFDAHQMSVYTVRFNPFHGSVFLSASADWTVKLWDHTKSKPLVSFDLNSSVGDVAWAPYSSTVFAAVTADGKVFIFDLNENKYEAICEQQVVRKAKLTHCAFNPFEPILLVGDDKGTVISLKLSPNLRRVCDVDCATIY
ncbi:cytoplasmic dynein with WD40 domain [Entophlyctis sp. JEL0112]|nr:cytoplasmic dynein with WD40 domain [Entophlyctis sp. JEL0112]